MPLSARVCTRVSAHVCTFGTGGYVLVRVCFHFELACILVCTHARRDMLVCVLKFSVQCTLIYMSVRMSVQVSHASLSVPRYCACALHVYAVHGLMHTYVCVRVCVCVCARAWVCCVFECVCAVCLDVTYYMCMLACVFARR